MIAKNLINDTVPPLRSTDDGNKALTWMSEFHLQHLPVVDGQLYKGIISEYDILDKNASKQALEAYDFNFSRPFVTERDHIYEVIKKINQHRLSLIPVLNVEEEYQGVITVEGLLDHFAKTNAMQDPGGIITLKMAVSDYVLSEIARIVESHNARILSLYVTTPSNSTQMEVTLKINKTDLAKVISTLERYDYEVDAAYQETEYLEDMQDRYDSFMHYLNI
ncbi:MAG: CBS domain-containing protein [Chitinophagales bacterium]